MWVPKVTVGGKGVGTDTGSSVALLPETMQSAGVNTGSAGLVHWMSHTSCPRCFGRRKVGSEGTGGQWDPRLVCGQASAHWCTCCGAASPVAPSALWHWGPRSRQSPAMPAWAPGSLQGRVVITTFFTLSSLPTFPLLLLPNLCLSFNLLGHISTTTMFSCCRKPSSNSPVLSKTNKATQP